MRLRSRLLAGVLTLGLALSACGSGDSDSKGPTKQVTVAGQSYTVPERPQRVVTLWQPTLAALTALDVPVVGTVGEPNAPDHGLSPYLPADGKKRDYEIVSNSAAVDDVNIEKIAALKPDLIIGTSTNNGKQSAVVEKLRDTAPTVLLPWKASGDWRTHFEQVAQLLGHEDAGRKIVQAYQSEIATARKSAPAKATVSATRIQKPDEFRIATPASFSGQVLADLGLRRPAGQQKPDPNRDYIAISPERLTEADAQYLFVLPNRSRNVTAQQMTSNPLFGKLTATRAGHAYEMDNAFWDGSNYYAASRIIADTTKAFTNKLSPLKAG